MDRLCRISDANLLQEKAKKLLAAVLQTLAVSGIDDPY